MPKVMYKDEVISGSSDFYLLRQNNYVYAVEDEAYIETLRAPLVLRCAVAGTSGSSAPNLANKDIGDTVTDGTVTWVISKMGSGGSKFAYDSTTNEFYPKTPEEMSAADLPVEVNTVKSLINDSVGFMLRQKSTAYSVDDTVYVESLGIKYRLECKSAGTTSSTDITPTVSDLDTDITDGTVTWTVKEAGSGNIPVATQSEDGLMSSVDKTKLDSITIDPDGSIVSKSHRWGIRIDKRNSDPNTRCEYILDAQGMGPAGMNFTLDTFDYGDWGDLWFVKNNKPCILLPDGTVESYLDPNDYTKDIEGNSVNITSHATGNVMSEIPLVWVKRWQDGRYEYEVVSDTQYDETYKAYAHTNSSGTVKNKFYYSCYGGSGSSSLMRSLSGKSVLNSLTATQEITAATANGTGWYTHTWSQRELIRTLVTLMGCTTDTQTVFGRGNNNSGSGAGYIKTTGTLNNKGQFYGANNDTTQVKVFHIEKFWGDRWDRIAGLINYNGKIYYKMTPEGDGYRVTDVNGYTNSGITPSGSSGGYISQTQCGEYGILPAVASGSSTTYYTDGLWFNNSGAMYAFVGGDSDNGALVGAFYSYLASAASASHWGIGASLSCIDES